MKLSKKRGARNGKAATPTVRAGCAARGAAKPTQTCPEHEIQETPILVECVQRLWDAVCAGAHREGKHEPQEDREV